MFLFILHYDKGLEPVEKFLVEHRAFLDEQYKQQHFICSGAQSPRTGGIILCGVDNRDQAIAIMEQDPFYQNDAVRYEIIEFTPSKFAPAFQAFIHH